MSVRVFWSLNVIDDPYCEVKYVVYAIYVLACSGSTLVPSHWIYLSSRLVGRPWSLLSDIIQFARPKTRLLMFCFDYRVAESPHPH